MSKAILYVRKEDPGSILIVNQKGGLRKLYCPFRVVCIRRIRSIQKYTSVYVEEVLINNKEELVYVIQGMPYPYHHFIVVISF